LDAHNNVSFLRPTASRECVDAFLGYLKRRGRSPLTVKQYSPILEAFVRWSGERTPASLSTADLDFGFLGAWTEAFESRRGRPPSPQTMRGVVGTVGSFYRFLTDYGFLVDAEGRPVANPAKALEGPQITQKPNDFLRPHEDRRLFDEIRMNQQEEILVWLLRWTGIRIGEALSLRQGDVDLAEGVICVPTSKTASGIRTVPIPPELRLRINRWLDHLHRQGLLGPQLPFLVTRNRTPMVPQHVEKLLRRVGKRADINGRLTAHRLRRTYASHLLNEGMRLESVSKLLGHSNTAITEKAYASLLDATIRAELNAVLGGANPP
jgi:integrase/recombinase XerD